MQIDSPPSFPLPGFAFRQLERSDKDAWYAYLSIPDVHEHTSWSLKSAADLDPLFTAYESTAVNSMRRLAIIDTGTGDLAGTIGFHTLSDVNRSAELAYDISPAHWGKGIGTAAAREVVQWAQREYGWIRIQATTLTTNQRSMRVLEKCGFEFEGLLRAYRMVRGTPGHFNMYALINASTS
jgi:[ribosomal protein S5]-alanine N-acetyltransferase